MRIEAVGQPALTAHQNGLLRAGERLILEHVASGKRLLARVSYNAEAPLWDARHGVILVGCYVVIAGLLDVPEATE